MLSPGRVYLRRTPRTAWKVAPLRTRAKVEAEKRARIKEDSLKKLNKK
jgi:hypothetical protein